MAHVSITRHFDLKLAEQKKATDEEIDGMLIHIADLEDGKDDVNPHPASRRVRKRKAGN